MKKYLSLFALGLTLVQPVFAAEGDQSHDYPTAERVQFVEACMNDYPDKGRFEMINKCSCLVDNLAKKYTYEQFVDMTTAAKASTIAGERGNVVRDSALGKTLNAEYKKASAAAKEACFLQ